MNASDVRKAIEKIESLSSIPVVLNRILRITGDPASSPEDLYEVIGRDPAIAARVIKIANSPFFGHPGKVGGIDQAIMLLGYEHIRNIAVSISVVSMFSKKGDLNLGNFWAHSFEVAFISAFLAEKATIVNSQEAFLSGLLHDIGRLIFYKLYRDKYRSILGTDDLLEKEMLIFGCDHAEAGGWFAKKNKFPAAQVLAIQFHHVPSGAREFTDIVSIVSLAEGLSRRYSPKIEDDGIWTEEHDAILLELGLSNEDLEEIGMRLGQEALEIQSFLELI